MFSINDVIDIALRVEKNGEHTYRAAAEAASDMGLARLLAWLADQEAEHARWFEDLGRAVGRGEVDEDLARHGSSMLQKVLGEASFSLDDVDLAAMETMREVLEAAAELELDTIIFYRMICGFVTEASTLAHLRLIIEEEARHGRMLEAYLEEGRLPSAEELAAL